MSMKRSEDVVLLELIRSGWHEWQKDMGAENFAEA